MKLLKKAQIGNIQGFVLAIITVAVVLAIGLIVLTELGTTVKELKTTGVINESVTVVEGVGTVSQSALFVSASAVRNVTNETIASTEYNWTSNGVVTIAGNKSDQYWVDYTHYTPSAAFNSTGTILTKLATVPTWLGIIIIVALAFVVLSFFLGRKQ